MRTYFIVFAVFAVIAIVLLVFLCRRIRKRCYVESVNETSKPKYSPAPVDALSREFKRLAISSGGSVGVFALHLESGRHAEFNSEQKFPMASLFKVPLTVALLAQADSDRLDLNRMIEVQTADLRAGSGLLQMVFKQPRVTLSILSLIDLMLVASDNSASDILLRLVGGPDTVNDQMQQIGISDIRVDRSTFELIADFDADLKKFLSNAQDTSTPEAMTRLLEKIWRGEALRPATAELLLDAMRRCQTGPDRLLGLLPDSAEVAHKTGSLVVVVNDTGIITLPDKTHLAISVLTINIKATEAERDRIIAEIARAAFDYFLFIK